MNLILRNRENELDPMGEFDKFRQELGRFFDFGLENAGLFDRELSPAVDLVETTDGYELVVDLPGVDKKDLELTVENNVLTIVGEKKDAKNVKHFFRKETWSGTFRRTVSLPVAADSGKVQATLEDGVLVVKIGKREELKPRQIEVASR